MIPEDEQARRGEPVIVTGSNGREQKGTIEWGGVTMPASIYCESGGRVTGVAVGNIRPDPGGARPVWASLGLKLGSRTRSAK